MRIVIPGRPITKKNSSQIITVHNRPMIIPSKQYRAYEERAGYYIRCKGKEISRPVNVKCVYYMPTRHRVDLPNLLEATDDILVKYRVLADDNSLVVAGHDGSRVLYDKENPRVEIDIEDVVEVVRCKYCKYSVPDEMLTENYKCEKIGMRVFYGEHFCSYGKRKDEKKH